MQKVRFKMQYGKYRAKKTYELSNNEAADLIQQGVASLVSTPLPSPTVKPRRRTRMMRPKRSRGYRTK